MLHSPQANKPTAETRIAMRIKALPHYKKISLMALIILTACASNDRSGREIGLFDTTIKGEDIRLFRYILPLFREKPKPIGMRADGSKTQNVDPKENEEAQLRRAEYFLKQDPRVKDYCPNGYTMIDIYAVLNEIIIRGECKYSAP